ncbi:MAG: aspartate-semialdehyde dehydrogenase [Planctomycetota bacterium]
MRIAVVGATGAVGKELFDLLAANRLPADDIVAISSPRSVGKKVMCGDRELSVIALADGCFDGVDIAFFSAGGGTSLEWAPKAAAAGAIVVDNSSAFRMEADVPLVVPEINAHALDSLGERRIVANPNCTTAVFLMAAAPLHKVAGLKAVIASSYQAVSGSGAKAIDELEQQARAWAAGKEFPPRQVYPHDIAFNVLPHVDKFLPDGHTKEEMKLQNESRKIMEHPTLKVTCTCVRVPVFRAHSVAASLWLEKPLSPDEAREVLRQAKGIVVQDDPAANVYPQPRERAGHHDCAVGRIRKDNVFEPGLALWVVGDQLLKGAALNAMQIAEALVERQLVPQR